jgi:predicted dehydrogenase
MSLPLRIGVIGCGAVTETRHLPALKDLSSVRVVAVADPDAERRARVGRSLGAERAHADFHDVLDDDSIDAVAVCVPARLHVTVALAAIEAGKHVLVEKPVALSLDESQRLMERALSSPVKVMVGFNLRWHRLVRRAHESLAGNAIGEVALIRSQFTSHLDGVTDWRLRRDLGGGSLLELAVHLFDLWRYLGGVELEEVFAFRHDGRWEDEAATVSARTAGGVLATALVSQGTAETNEIELFGRAGRLKVGLYRFDGLESTPSDGIPGGFGKRLAESVVALRELPQGLAQSRRGGDFLASYCSEWEHFVDCIRRDVPVQCTLEDGHRALELALAAIASASRGRPVRVADVPRTVKAAAAGS